MAEIWLPWSLPRPKRRSDPAGGAGALVEPLVAFGGELRQRGLDVGPGRVESAVRAVACVEGRDMDETYWALRCALLSRREDAEAFDDAFAAFWRGMPVAGMQHEQSLPGRSEEERDQRAPGGSEEGETPRAPSGRLSPKARRRLPLTRRSASSSAPSSACAR